MTYVILTALVLGLIGYALGGWVGVLGALAVPTVLFFAFLMLVLGRLPK